LFFHSLGHLDTRLLLVNSWIGAVALAVAVTAGVLLWGAQLFELVVAVQLPVCGGNFWSEYHVKVCTGSCCKIR